MATGTNGIGTCDDFYQAGGWMTAWEGIDRCPTRGEVASYLGVTTTPTDQCIKFSAWGNKKLSTTPTYYIEVDSSDNIKNNSTINKLIDSFSSDDFICRVAEYKWDGKDDIYQRAIDCPLTVSGTKGLTSISIFPNVPSANGYYSYSVLDYGQQTVDVTTNSGYTFSIRIPGYVYMEIPEPENPSNPNPDPGTPEESSSSSSE